MILYKKIFPLDKGISFSQYITALRKAYFPNFVVTVDKILTTENYRALLFFTAPLWRWGWANVFYEGVLLKECLIQYSEGERHFTIQASARTVNLFLASFYALGAILFFILAIVTIIINSGMSLNNLFGFAAIITIMLAPLIGVYLRDKKLLDKAGSIGKELERT
jgi:hypothetical protein